MDARRDREEASRRGDEMSRARDLDRFYDVLERLRLKLGGCRCLGACGGGGGEGWRWPSQGVYFFFEPGEMREDGRTPRVVRVGTHAVYEGSKTTLWQRLSRHKGHERGKYAGGGNHRGSVFQLHWSAIRRAFSPGTQTRTPTMRWTLPRSSLVSAGRISSAS